MKYLILICLVLSRQIVGEDECKADEDCGNGKCTEEDKKCICDSGFLTYKEQPCSYKQLNLFNALLFSLLLGYVGADWFYLSRGSMCFIAIGFVKMYSLILCVLFLLIFLKSKQGASKSRCFRQIFLFVGLITGLLIIGWYAIDVFRIITNIALDGNNMPMQKFQ